MTDQTTTAVQRLVDGLEKLQEAIATWLKAIEDAPDDVDGESASKSEGR